MTNPSINYTDIKQEGKYLRVEDADGNTAFEFYLGQNFIILDKGTNELFFRDQNSAMSWQPDWFPVTVEDIDAASTVVVNDLATLKTNIEGLRTTYNFTGGGSGGSVFQNQVETLIYAATPVEGASYTHSVTEGTSGATVAFGNVYVSRQYIGSGLAKVKFEGFTTYYGNDSAIVMTLPTNYLTEYHWGIIDRNELNTTAEIVISNPANDQISFNRDNDIDGVSNFGWHVSGIGKWVGTQPTA